MVLFQFQINPNPNPGNFETESLVRSIVKSVDVNKFVFKHSWCNANEMKQLDGASAFCLSSM